MKYSLVIKEEAAKEINEAFDWYQCQKDGLGLKFIDELEVYFKIVSGKPLMYPIGKGKEHVAVMKRFPFKVVYTIEDTNVVIFAVFHTSRNPKKI